METSNQSNKKPEDVKDLQPKESKLRSILKALTWRVIATSTTFTISLFAFGEDEHALEKASMVGALDLVIKLVLYYLHERGWQRLPSGSIRSMFRRNS